MRAFLHRAARTLVLVFPFTLRGLLLSLLAAAVLAAGVLRADLAALFWGASFLLFAAYALAGGHLLRLALLSRYKRDREMVRVALPSPGTFPGEEAEARVDASLPRAGPPGFSCRVSLPLEWQARRLEAISVRMPRGTSSNAVRFRAPWRGAFSSSAVRVECRDILGFTAARAELPLRDTLTVYPALRDAGAAARFMEQSDEAAVESRRRRRSEELLEARKYYPGDDVRRLNWKVFAHLNELFLRTGEEVPPPEARLLFVLDSTANPLVPRAAASDYLDALVSSCISVMDALLDARRETMLSVPGRRECVSFGSRAALLTYAAGVPWTGEPWSPDLPVRPMHVAVFSSPGSPGLSRIMTRIRSAGWSASLFIKSLEPEQPRRRRRLVDYLLLPREGDALMRGPAPQDSRVSRAERRALADAAGSDLSLYAGGKVRHAGEV